MGLFGKSQQQLFNELCASTLLRISNSPLNDADTERFSYQFLMKAKAAADDKSCDVMAVTRRAASEAIFMVNEFTRQQEEFARLRQERKAGNS